MSRIHEALQRAEHERKSRNLSQDDSTPSSSGPSRTQSPSVPAEHMALLDDVTSPAFSPFSANGVEPPTIDTLTTRCRQMEWNPQQHAMLLSGESAHQYKAEVFRTLRSRLYRLRDQSPLRSLLITSTLPAEGKSFIAVNLSQAIAQQYGRRAILIDADLRMPKQHLLLGAPQFPGLTEYLRAETDELSIIQRGQNHDLHFIPSGQAVTNPVELIGNGRLKELLHRLKDIFDWIILDSPPMAPVSDAGLLSDMCDGALLVVRAGMTPYDLAQKACADFKHTPLVGVILNAVDGTSHYGSYYYSYYSGAKTGKSQR